MKLNGILAAAAIAALAAGCSSTAKILQNYENGISMGSYAVPAEEAAKMAEKEKGDPDELMWRLLAGSAYHIGGDKESAVRQFDIAETLFAANDTTPPFARGAQAAKAMMLNDSHFDYDGGGLERIFTCLYKGIDFASATGVGVDNKELARIEFNRASTYQSRWLDARRSPLRRPSSAKALQPRRRSRSRSRRATATTSSPRLSPTKRSQCSFPRSAVSTSPRQAT